MIHLLDDPLAALKELDRVCKPGGKLIIPTYMNREKKEQDSGFISALDKAGAGFKQQFTASRYKQFFVDAGYKDVKVSMAEGRIPCAVAEQMNVTKPSVTNATRLLREGSFLTMDEDKRIHLMELGREIAESIYERRCILTEGLIFLGVGPETAEQDACRIEHDLSRETFEKIKEAWQGHLDQKRGKA